MILRTVGALLLFCTLLVDPATAQGPAEGDQTAAGARRTLTVEDLINAATLDKPDADSVAGRGTGWLAGAPWLVSPDRRHVAFVLRRGNAQQETYEAELLIYDADKFLSGAKPWRAATMSSGNAVPPILSARWSADGRSLLFLGQRMGKPGQVFAADLENHRLRQLTHESQNVIWFDYSAKSGHFVIAIDTLPTTPGSNDPAMQGGVLYDEIHDQFSLGTHAPFTNLARYDFRTGRRSIALSPKQTDPGASAGERPYQSPGLAGGLSPDGRYGLREVFVVQRPGPEEWWAEYAFNTTQSSPFGNVKRGAIVDFDGGAAKILPFPVIVANEQTAFWIESDEGIGLVIPNAYEPLEGITGPERDLRASRIAVVEVDPASGAYRRIARLGEDANDVRGTWHRDSQTLELSFRVKGELRSIQYRKDGRDWREVKPSNDGVKDVVIENQPAGNVRLALSQSLNEPPVLTVTDIVTGAQRVVLDPNPQLRTLNLGHGEQIGWTATDGRKWSGVIYYPPDYQAGKRYPLVIQTHGFKPDHFSLHGFPYDYLGRALTAKGFIVLQASDAPDYYKLILSPEMMPAHQRGYEAAIDELDRRGLIDRTRIGMTGWSATGPLTARMLAYSTYPIVTAVFGATAIHPYWNEDGRLDSAMPTPEQVSEGSFLDKVYHPINLNRIHSSIFSYSGMWYDPTTWPRAMRNLGKPFEYWRIARHTHIMFDVSQRIRFGHLTLDWYRFWLQDYQDPDPAKAEQYRRWRQLRVQYNVDHRKAGMPTLPDLPALQR